MKFEKKVLCEIEKCYAVLGREIGGEPYLLFAGEGNGSVRAFHGPDFSRCDLIWEGGGGTMSIVPLERREGYFMISRGFYTMVNSAESTIEIVRLQNGAFTHEPVASLPYLHRFGVLRAQDGSDYLIACSIADHKADLEDWSHPGHVYAAKLPENLDSSFTLELTRLPGDYTMNHGFCTAMREGCQAAFIGAREGVFAFTPPCCGNADWKVEQLVDFPVSDVAVSDLDGDGEDELALILPFHGNQYKIFKKSPDGYSEVFSYPVEQDFYHTVISATLAGEKVFVGGARRGPMHLFIVRYDHAAGKYFAELVEEDAGPSNAFVLNLPGQDLLLSANREHAQAAVYTLKPEQ